MALSRAFTSRRKASDAAAPPPTRSASARIQSRRAVRRSQISAPMELLSTTNMLSFNAPDIHTFSTQYSTSEEDSDMAQTAMSSPPTSVEASPIESRSGSPEPNHLSTYFQLSRASAQTTSSSKSNRTSSDSPAIPQRAPSHTKSAHAAIARQRAESAQRSPPPNSMPSPRGVVVESRSVVPHPFGRELEQLDRVAEGFGLRDGVMEEEEETLRRKGLSKFTVNDYLAEIESLFGGVFEDQLMPVAVAWI